eukprot:comp23303_c2_seq2/m.38267 comp23303_c2_seq2/g.38267  ORF comp23303_c2_seq2/g.38267 comp23303_c2_seq2/m.38267 type:complete len:496 (-) comp23303_c2_seq2:267-1754(-)
MEVFAGRYHQCNPGTFRDRDTGYVLAFSVVMLNTDRHNPSVVKKMTKTDFIRNNRGIDAGQDLPPTFLGSVYDEVSQQEILTSDRAVDRSMRLSALISGLPPSLPVRPHREFIMRAEAEKVVPGDRRRFGRYHRELFLFNDALLLTKVVKSGNNSKYVAHVALYGASVLVLPPLIHDRGGGGCERRHNMIVYSFVGSSRHHLSFRTKLELDMLVQKLAFYIDLCRMAFDDKLAEKGLSWAECPLAVEYVDDIKKIPPHLMPIDTEADRDKSTVLGLAASVTEDVLKTISMGRRESQDEQVKGGSGSLTGLRKRASTTGAGFGNELQKLGQMLAVGNLVSRMQALSPNTLRRSSSGISSNRAAMQVDAASMAFIKPRASQGAASAPPTLPAINSVISALEPAIDLARAEHTINAYRDMVLAGTQGKASAYGTTLKELRTSVVNLRLELLQYLQMDASESKSEFFDDCQRLFDRASEILTLDQQHGQRLTGLATSSM